MGNTLYKVVTRFDMGMATDYYIRLPLTLEKAFKISNKLLNSMFVFLKAAFIFYYNQDKEVGGGGGGGSSNSSGGEDRGRKRKLYRQKALRTDRWKSQLIAALHGDLSSEKPNKASHYSNSNCH